MKIFLFRIFQEAVTNAIKYAKAHNLCLTVSTNKTNFEIVLIDDGSGFNPAEIHGEHYGLKNMEYRADEAGLQFLLKSEPNKGTEIRVKGSGVVV